MKMIELFLIGMFAMVLLSISINALVSGGSEFIYEGFINGGNSCTNFSMENSSGFINCDVLGLNVTDSSTAGDSALFINKLPNSSLADTNWSHTIFAKFEGLSVVWMPVQFMSQNKTADALQANMAYSKDDVSSAIEQYHAQQGTRGCTFTGAVIDEAHYNNVTMKRYTNNSLECFVNDTQVGYRDDLRFSAEGQDNITAFYVGDDINTGQSGKISIKSFWVKNLSFTIAVDTTKPIINTTFNITNVRVDDIINFSGNITDNSGLLMANITYNISGVITYVNFTDLSGTSVQISNVTRVCSSACILNFTMFATDTNNNVAQISKLLAVGDTIFPQILNYSISSASIVNGNEINITINASDNFRIDDINISVLNPKGSILNRSCENLNVISYLCNITFFDGDETSVVGVWNLTRVLVSDTSGNVNSTYPNITFEVTSAGGGGGSSGGGGGGGVPPQVIIQNVTLPIANCNFNQICEFGEDFIGCPEDCRTVDRLKTDYLFCDDPLKPCIKDDIKAIFASRNVVIRLSLFAVPLLMAAVFLPRESKLGKLFKEPLLKSFKKSK